MAGRSLAKDHEEKRQAILSQAADFFAQHGYDASSMRDLAEACGISKALIYHYYRSKEALLFDIIHSHLQRLYVNICAVEKNLNAPDYLFDLVQEILDTYRDADAQHKLQINAMERLPQAERQVLMQMQKDIVAVVADAIRALAPEKFVESPQLLTPVSMSLFGMLNWFYMWYKRDSRMTRRQYGDLVTNLVLGGIEDALDAARNSPEHESAT